jgi:hypothetical protein
VKIRLFLLSTALVASCALSASAAGEAPKPDPCRAVPDDPVQGKNKSSEQDAPTLGDCNGVLKPPPVGDPEMVKPAPQVGTMPVIPPEKVPGNQPGSMPKGISP